MRQLWILVALVGCNKPGGDGGSGGGGLLGDHSPAPDWSAKKLVSQTGSIEGLTFTIDVPDGLPRDKRQGGDWEDPDPKYDHAPKIFTSTIEIKRVQDLKEAKYHATLDANAKTWVREQTRPDSWALTMAEPDKKRIEAITYKQANDDVFIKCKAVQWTEHGTLPSYDKTRLMLETVCDSLKPTGGAMTAPAPPEAAEPGDRPVAKEDKPTEDRPAEDKPAEDKPVQERAPVHNDRADKAIDMAEKGRLLKASEAEKASEGE